MRSPRSLLVRLLAPYLLSIGAVALCLYLYTDRVVEQFYLDSLAEAAQRDAQLIASQIPWDTRGPELDARCGELAQRVRARVTVIDGDGTVLGDSSVRSSELENHRERPEVRQALQSGSGSNARLSASINERLFYVGWRESRAGNQRILRLALSLGTVDEARRRIRRAIWTGWALAALLALGPTLLMSRRLSTRLRALTDFSAAVAEDRPLPRFVAGPADLIGRLAANVAHMAQALRSQLETVSREKGRLEATLSGMVEGVLVVDGQGIVQLSNARARELFGARDPLEGRALIEVSRDPELHALLREALQAAPGECPAREISFEARRQVLQVSVSRIARPEGGAGHAVLVFHDITELKRLEAARRDFVANVSHELRTPLTAIRGYAETLMNGALEKPEVSRNFVAVIQRHSARLTRLTDDLLTLSDLELGRAALQRDFVELAPCIHAAADVVRDRAQQQGTELRQDIPSGLPTLFADPDRIEQVLVNLLDNAVKYTPAGGRVTVSVREAGGKERWLEVKVIDSGVGIPSGDLPRLTERFYRVDKARSRELGGTGLGLAIVKHIVQAHGGRLAIESEVGQGTTITLLLPCFDPQRT